MFIVINAFLDLRRMQNTYMTVEIFLPKRGT